MKMDMDDYEDFRIIDVKMHKLALLDYTAVAHYARIVFVWLYTAQTLSKESHDPVHKLIPSLLTPKQLTRLSWPTSEPTFSPRVISQTLHSKSSYPANSSLPETDVATDVMPHRIDSEPY